MGWGSMLKDYIDDKGVWRCKDKTEGKWLKVSPIMSKLRQEKTTTTVLFNVVYSIDTYKIIIYH